MSTVIDRQKRKIQQKIIRFHSEYPGCCICDIIKNRNEAGMYLEPDELSHYKVKCDECGYLRYDGPMYDGVLMA